MIQSFTKIEDIAHMIEVRNKNELDSFIIIEGMNGAGKSNLAVQLCRKGDPTYTVSPERILYKPTYDDLNEAVRTGKPRQYRHLDDIGDLFYKRNFAKSEQKSLNVFFMRSRKFFQNIVACIPDFDDLDPYFRNNRVMLRLHVPYRGICMVYQPDLRRGLSRWHLDEDATIMNKMSKNDYKQNIPVDKYLNILRALHGYCGEFHFPDWIPEDKKAYTEVIDYYNKKEEEAKHLTEVTQVPVSESLMEKFNKKDVIFNAVKNLLDEGRTEIDIAKLLGIHAVTVCKYKGRILASEGILAH